MNPNGNLERILECPIVVSWADLMRDAQTGLIHIEYGFAPTGTLDYLKVWSSITRGHWLLACEYWMSPSTFHGTGVRFENGYKSEGLARILEFVMQHENAFCFHRTSAGKDCSRFNADQRGEGSGCGLGERSLPRSRFRALTARGCLKIFALLTFPRPLNGGRGVVLFGAGPC
jgi:hypothetical protein